MLDIDEEDLVYRLSKRAEIRRQIPDRIADLLDEAAAEIEKLRQGNNQPNIL